MSAELLPRDSTTFFDDSRGVSLYVDTQRAHGSQLVRGGRAWAFAKRTTSSRRSLTILHRLVTGRLSPTNLSGPLGIIGVAGSSPRRGCRRCCCS